MKFFAQKRTVIFVIIGVSLVLSLNFFQKEVKGFFYSVSQPLQKIIWRKGGQNSSFLSAIFEAPNLKKENENLKLRIQELLSGQNKLRELEKENNMLREALGLGLQDEFRLGLSAIIGKDINRDSILIDKGSKDGVSDGLFVITSKKVLVGKIAEVYQNYSRVSLVSDKESFFEAKVSGSDITGLVKGLGSSKIFLDFIPKDEEIKEGDLIVARGFLIGLIKEVKKIDVNPFQQAEISPFFSIPALDEVFIVFDF